MPRSLARPVSTVVFAIVLCFGLGSSVSAQYFGQNKVQYRNLDFKVLKTQHFDLYFYPEEREGIDVAARLAERWHARLERVFEHTLRGRQPLVMFASHTDFEQNNIIPGEMGEGTGGVTEPLRRRIVLPFGGPLSDTDHVIGHELVHAFQFDITTSPGAGPGMNGAERLPLWFIEGMAEYLSLGPVDPNTAMWMRDAVRQEKLPMIKDLDNPKYFPYRWGQAFWAYVGGRYGDRVIRPMLSMAAAAGDIEVAIKQVLGLSSKELSNDWHDSLRKTYGPILAASTATGEAGRLIIKATDLTDLNVGPSISPDGKWLAFLSSRGFFSIDLYVADATTGKIIQKLTSTASDPHYSSIEFIYSAGAWDADSKRLAIATVTGGKPALAIFEAQTGHKDREVRVPDVDEVLNPTWAPDGHAVCFTGMSAGLTDLYLYDLNKGSVKRLTNDAFADMQPAWSPDGKRIAFATDRFSSNLQSLSIGNYRLALIDPDTGAIEQVRAFTSGKNINPQWSPDSSSLYFIGDRDGIANMYRVVLASGDVTQITTVGTGLSGITDTSPALSVGSAVGVAAFSVYESGKYDIYTLDVNRRGTPLNAPDFNAAILPPADRKPSEIAALLNDPTFGLPPVEQQAELTDYKPKLQLEAVGQPSVAVGASRYGAMIGGGVSFAFGDMLGNHQLITAIQVQSGITGNFSAKDIAGEVAYVNQAHRWNWGVVGGQIPYISAGFASGVGFVGSEPVQQDQLIVFRQTERSVAGLTQYPLNRADRVEFQAGVTQISFDEEVRTTTYSLNTGEIISDNSATIPLAQTLNLASTTGAYVHDTSSFGATSPVTGTRYRVEASPTFGSINYTSLLADYRKYMMPFPFYTIAGRIMHYGRYGSGADDNRLFPLYLGYPGLVRGYDVNTFDNTDCIPNAVSSCPQFDRLLGSRVLVGNLELRFPLLRPFGVSQRMYGPLPVEMAFFLDGGVAWNGLTQPSPVGIFTSSTQPQSFKLSNGVSSAGIAARVNFFGFAVGEFDFARPFQRPGAGWVFQFNLMPGF